MYSEDVPKNYVEAVKWYRRTANQGNATAQNNLGVQYYTGLGVMESDFEAVHWYRKAAKQGQCRCAIQPWCCICQRRRRAKDEVEAYAWILLTKDRGSKKRIWPSNFWKSG